MGLSWGQIQMMSPADGPFMGTDTDAPSRWVLHGDRYRCHQQMGPSWGQIQMSPADGSFMGTDTDVTSRWALHGDRYRCPQQMGPSWGQIQMSPADGPFIGTDTDVPSRWALHRDRYRCHQQMGPSWGQIQMFFHDIRRWWDLVDDLCFNRCNRARVSDQLKNLSQPHFLLRA